MKKRDVDKYLNRVRVAFIAVAVLGYFFLSFAIMLAMMDVTVSYYTVILLLSIIVLISSAYLVVGILIKKKSKLIGIFAIILSIFPLVMAMLYFYGGQIVFPLLQTLFSILLLLHLLNPAVRKYYFK